MKRTGNISFPLAIALLLPSVSRAQETLWHTYVNPGGQVVDLRIDTLSFDHFDPDHIYLATCALRSNGSVATGNGSWLNGVNVTECQDGNRGEQPRHDELTDITVDDSTLIIGSKFYSTCPQAFFCNLSLVEDTIINLINLDLGFVSKANCCCCHGLTYSTSFNKERVDKRPLYAMLNGDRRTLKRICR